MPSVLVAGRYTVALDRPMPEAAGVGQSAFAAEGPDGAALVAVRAARLHPPRLAALQSLCGEAVSGVLCPVAHGAAAAASGGGADQHYFVVVQAPPGGSLATSGRTWTEAALIDSILLHGAQALARLAARGLTHRGIRPDNVFQANPGEPVVLGQSWAAPPALFQPPAFDPPYMAMCLPEGRGEGSIADDIYALGALLVWAALGGTRLDGMSPAEAIRLKLELGSFQALVGEGRLPGMVADLARGMLAEDPDHRPAPALLLDPAAARARRLAARPPRRASAPIRIGSLAVWTARAAAFSVAMQPEAGAAAIASGMLDLWLRRGLGDPNLAARVDDAVHLGGPGQAAAGAADEDALRSLRAVAVLDPLAPLTWRGAALWPDGLGPALARAQADGAPHRQSVQELACSEATVQWAALRPGRSDLPAARAEARKRLALLGGGRAGPVRSLALRRLAHALNPLLPCPSPRLHGCWVVRPADLLPALEQVVAAQRPEGGTGSLLDGEILAFLEGHGETAAGRDQAGQGAALAELALLSRLQERWGGIFPALAAWIAANPERLLEGWRGAEMRERLAQEVRVLAASGRLAPMLALVCDPAARAQDEAGSRQALLRLSAIDAELAALAAGQDRRRASARGLGHEAAAGLGLAAAAASILALLLA